MKSTILNYIKEIQDAKIEQFKDRAAEVEQFRIKYLGKKGVLSNLFEQFKSLPNDQKKDFFKFSPSLPPHLF